jgi:hypothetical protein
VPESKWQPKEDKKLTEFLANGSKEISHASARRN